MPAAPKCWLLKCEPDVFSVDDLEKQGKCGWEGVRNYQARNHLKDMALGDKVIFYHSNANPSGAVGTAKVVTTAFPDPHQFDPKSPYCDADSPPDAPRWVSVEIAFVEKFVRLVPLDELKAHPALAEMKVVKKGNRLSVTPVTPAEFAVVQKLGRRSA